MNAGCWRELRSLNFSSLCRTTRDIWTCKTLWRFPLAFSPRWPPARDFHSLLYRRYASIHYPVSVCHLTAIRLLLSTGSFNLRARHRKNVYRYSREMHGRETMVLFNCVTDEKSPAVHATEIANYLPTGILYFACSIRMDITVSQQHTRGALLIFP